MISKTVTYNNLLTGEPVTEELWFHLRKDEIIRIMGRAKKDWDDYIKEMMSREDVDEIFDFAESILKMAYGERSEDGRTFRKDKKLQEDFANSEAYSELFIDMITDAVSADGKETSKFFSALVGDPNKGTVPESVSKLKK
jgi:hypothetical protein